jgi:Tfp pilus assembly protein PilX
MSLPRVSSRRGATLPLSLLVIGILGLAVAGSANMLSSERQVSSDHEAQLDAFSVAQSGLEQYFSTINGMPPASVDTTITTLPGGSAVISLRRLRDSSGTIPATFVITSRGTASVATRYGARAPTAERTVAQYAVWTAATFDIDAAFTSLSGLDKNGNSGALDGNDACAGSGKPAIAGVAVPTGTYTGQTGPINGNPDNTPKNLGTSGINGQAKDSVRVDWANIKTGAAIPPDYTIPTNSWPTTAQFANWPVVYTNGNLSLSGGSTDGKGILIVTGDLTISGSYHWDGIVLVGGSITSNGNNTILGAVITGLNVKTGTAVPQEAVGNGNKTFQYQSCNIASALNHIGSLQRLRNAWTDTWSSY